MTETASSDGSPPASSSTPPSSDQSVVRSAAGCVSRIAVWHIDGESSSNRSWCASCTVVAVTSTRCAECGTFTKMEYTHASASDLCLYLRARYATPFASSRSMNGETSLVKKDAMFAANLSHSNESDERSPCILFHEWTQSATLMSPSFVTWLSK